MKEGACCHYWNALSCINSLAATQLINPVQRNLGLLLPLTTLFRYPTVERLADHLTWELRFQKQQRLDAHLTPLSSMVLDELTETETETLLANKLAIIEEILNDCSR